MKNLIVKDVIATILLMMFFYAGFSKYFDYREYVAGMHRQPFPYWMSAALIIFLPPAEIGTAVLLLTDKYRDQGLQAAFLLMTIFTAYVTSILLHFFKNVPCSCGGLIKHMSWPTHFWFNVFFLTIAVLGLQISRINRGTTEQFKS